MSAVHRHPQGKTMSRYKDPYPQALYDHLVRERLPPAGTAAIAAREDLDPGLSRPAADRGRRARTAIGRLARARQPVPATRETTLLLLRAHAPPAPTELLQLLAAQRAKLKMPRDRLGRAARVWSSASCRASTSRARDGLRRAAAAGAQGAGVHAADGLGQRDPGLVRTRAGEGLGVLWQVGERGLDLADQESEVAAELEADLVDVRLPHGGRVARGPSHDRPGQAFMGLAVRRKVVVAGAGRVVDDAAVRHAFTPVRTASSGGSTEVTETPWRRRNRCSTSHRPR